MCCYAKRIARSHSGSPAPSLDDQSSHIALAMSCSTTIIVGNLLAQYRRLLCKLVGGVQTAIDSFWRSNQISYVQLFYGTARWTRYPTLTHLSYSLEEAASKPTFRVISAGGEGYDPSQRVLEARVLPIRRTAH